MLETIREFALERLEETGGAEELRERYSAYFLELAELARPELLARSSSIWFDRLEAEHDNIRAVLGDALEHGRTDVALRLGGAIWHFWWTRGYWSEGRRWLESALAAGTESDPQLRFERALGRRPACHLAGGRRAGQRRGGGAARTCRGDGFHAGEGQCTSRDSSPPSARRLDHAAQLYEESARLAREQGDSGLLTHCREQPRQRSRSTAASTSARWSSSRRAWRSAGSGQDHDLVARAFVESRLHDVDARRHRARARATARRSGCGA